MPTHPDASDNDSGSQTQWVEDEFRTLDLGDPRRERRLKKIAADLLAQPGVSIPRSSGDWAGAKAADRLFDNAALEPAAVLGAHRQAVLGRARGLAVVLAVQDNTSLNFSTHRHTRGLGPIRNHADKTIGLLLHTTLLLREDGQALGVLDALVLARDPAQFKAGAKGARNRKPAGQNESRKWMQSAAAGRKHDGHPGMIALWRGLQRLHDITTAWQIFTQARMLWVMVSPLALCGRRRSRGGLTAGLRRRAAPTTSLRSCQSPGGPAHSKASQPCAVSIRNHALSAALGSSCARLRSRCA
jgi:hypothetical protein